MRFLLIMKVKEWLGKENIADCEKISTETTYTQCFVWARRLLIFAQGLPRSSLVKSTLTLQAVREVCVCV